MIRITAFMAIGLLCPLILIACHSDDHGHDNLETGKALFEHHCSVCHRQDGNGLFLKGYPPIKSTTLDSWQIKHKIRDDAEEGRNMPSFKDMPEAEAAKIANYVKSLNIQ